MCTVPEHLSPLPVNCVLKGKDTMGTAGRSLMGLAVKALSLYEARELGGIEGVYKSGFCFVRNSISFGEGKR